MFVSHGAGWRLTLLSVGLNPVSLYEHPTERLVTASGLPDGR